MHENRNAPMVSIITPVYKVVDYLPKMIDSIVTQSYSDFELWLVDDGSPDCCGELCDEAAKKDGRIHVIHKENGGAASARNAAMDVARGKYFHFVDSDDWIEPDMLELLVSAAEKYASMLTITGICMEYYEDGKHYAYDISPEPHIYSSASQFHQQAYQYLMGRLLNQPVAKLYQADLIREKHIRFPNTMWDDAYFNFEYLKYVESVAFVPGAPYHYYRSRPGSETKMIFVDTDRLYYKRLDIYSRILELYDYWGVHDEQSMSSVHGWLISRMVECVQETAVHPDLSKREKREKIARIIDDPQLRESIKDTKSLPAVMKIAALPMKMHSVTLCCMMGKMIGFIKQHKSGIFLTLFTKVVHQGKERKA